MHYRNKESNVVWSSINHWLSVGLLGLLLLDVLVVWREDHRLGHPWLVLVCEGIGLLHHVVIGRMLVLVLYMPLLSCHIVGIK